MRIVLDHYHNKRAKIPLDQWKPIDHLWNLCITRSFQIVSPPSSSVLSSSIPILFPLCACVCVCVCVYVCLCFVVGDTRCAHENLFLLLKRPRFVVGVVVVIVYTLRCFGIATTFASSTFSMNWTFIY